MQDDKKQTQCSEAKTALRRIRRYGPITVPLALIGIALAIPIVYPIFNS